MDLKKKVLILWVLGFLILGILITQVYYSEYESILDLIQDFGFIMSFIIMVNIFIMSIGFSKKTP